MGHPEWVVSRAGADRPEWGARGSPGAHCQTLSEDSIDANLRGHQPGRCEAEA